jgi:hypothetical protein
MTCMTRATVSTLTNTNPARPDDVARDFCTSTHTVTIAGSPA